MIYLVPSLLAEDAVETIPAYITASIKNCQVIFAENERTARRFLKSICKEIVIDNFEWYAIHKAEQEQIQTFRKKITERKNIAIISEAGCPGIADPGQILIHEAQQMGEIVKPLVGPSSILLALMASGLNGQHFSFAGYLPIDNNERIKKIKQLEEESRKIKCTQIFIETPYRNNQLLETLVKTLHPQTKICVAVDLTSSNETIKTKTTQQWKIAMPQIHKKPVIFLIYSGN